MLRNTSCEHAFATIQRLGSRLREIELDEFTVGVPLIYSACQTAQGAQSGARNVIAQTLFRLNKFSFHFQSYTDRLTVCCLEIPCCVCRRIPQSWLLGRTLIVNPIRDLERPRGFQEVEAPRFQDNGHMKVVRLSALYPPGNIPGTHFC
jgi:hypothetical protein